MEKGIGIANTEASLKQISGFDGIKIGIKISGKPKKKRLYLMDSRFIQELR